MDVAAKNFNLIVSVMLTVSARAMCYHYRFVMFDRATLEQWAA